MSQVIVTQPAAMPVTTAMTAASPGAQAAVKVRNVLVCVCACERERGKERVMSVTLASVCMHAPVCVTEIGGKGTWVLVRTQVC